MKYAKIEYFEYVNGEGIGCSLFVSGCKFRCDGCFNKEAWDFEFGEEFTEDTYNHLKEYLSKDHIKRLSILGGEPICDENVATVLKIIASVRKDFPKISIWLYTGYELGFDGTFSTLPESGNEYDAMRADAVHMSDVVVCGLFEKSKADLSLKFRGSKNQRVIKIQQSLKRKKIVKET